MIEKYLAWDQSLFRNEEVFESRYLPEHFPHRDSQMGSLSYAVAPGFKGMEPQNVICVGPPGTGKTTTIQKLVEEIEQTPQETSMLIPVYVNCRLNRTHRAVIAEIQKKVLGIPAPVLAPLKNMYEKIGKKMCQDRALFIILDDADFLVYSRVLDEVLYGLLRFPEGYAVKIGVATVHTLGIPSLDSRVSSVFLPETIRFNPYGWDETYDILKKRVEIGLYPGVLENSTLEKIVDHTARSRDLRFGIDLIKRSVLIAEQRASLMVSLSDVEKALAKTVEARVSKYLKTLSRPQIILFQIASYLESSQSGALYDRFREKTGLKYTSFYKCLNKLEETKLVQVRDINAGKNGRTRIVTSKYPGVIMV